VRFSLLSGVVFAVAATTVMWSCGGGSMVPSPTASTAALNVLFANGMANNGAQSFSPSLASVSQGGPL
jgi:hypothetical protein